MADNKDKPCIFCGKKRKCPHCPPLTAQVPDDHQPASISRSGGTYIKPRHPSMDDQERVDEA